MLPSSASKQSSALEILERPHGEVGGLSWHHETRVHHLGRQRMHRQVCHGRVSRQRIHVARRVQIVVWQVTLVQRMLTGAVFFTLQRRSSSFLRFLGPTPPTVSLAWNSGEVWRLAVANLWQISGQILLWSSWTPQLGSETEETRVVGGGGGVDLDQAEEVVVILTTLQQMLAGSLGWSLEPVCHLLILKSDCGYILNPFKCKWNPSGWKVQNLNWSWIDTHCFIPNS